MQRKKICVVTATRAEYGLLKNTIRRIDENPKVELCLIVTGTHLSKNFGHTIEEIDSDGFSIAEKVDILQDSDSPTAISRSMGIAMILFAEVFERQKPDMLLVLGDRYELISICSCALNCNIPIAHISGGEITEGAIDDCIRHCITKMSVLHFPGCEEYRRRIIQLGEQPQHVYNYGDVGIENILTTPHIEISQLEKELKVKLNNYICVTFHPVTTQLCDMELQLQALLEAMEEFPNIDFIVTKANADSGGRYVNGRLEEFAKTHTNVHLFASLGIIRYINVLKNAKAIIGNSSSGIVEAPCLRVPTVNIGDRQKGRLQAESIVNVPPEKNAIVSAIRTVLSRDWRQCLKNINSPYEDGETSKRIVEEIIAFLELEKSNYRKQFYDIPILERANYEESCNYSG